MKQLILLKYFATFSIIDDSLSHYIDQSVNLIKHAYLKDKLIELQRTTKGANAFNFSLPDSNGKVVRLSDLKGKVVVLDFWYTGCIWCTVLAKTIKPVIQKNIEKGVVFISISVDKEKARWKESLRTGLYTSSEEINLYTGGKGKDHTLIKYYNIGSYPKLFIIDRKGKISSIDLLLKSEPELRVAALQKSIDFL